MFFSFKARFARCSLNFLTRSSCICCASLASACRFLSASSSASFMRCSSSCLASCSLSLTSFSFFSCSSRKASIAACARSSSILVKAASLRISSSSSVASLSQYNTSPSPFRWSCSSSSVAGKVEWSKRDSASATVVAATFDCDSCSRPKKFAPIDGDSCLTCSY